MLVNALSWIYLLLLCVFMYVHAHSCSLQQLLLSPPFHLSLSLSVILYLPSVGVHGVAGKSAEFLALSSLSWIRGYSCHQPKLTGVQ